MEIITISALKALITSHLSGAVVAAKLTFNPLDSLRDIRGQLEDLDITMDYSVDYYAEAWEIVGGSEFDAYIPDEIDFSGYNSALECLQHQAQQQINGAIMTLQGECIEELAEAISEVCDEAYGIKCHVDLQVSCHDPYGWAPHDYETDGGICIHNKLERELKAISGAAGDLYVFACWNDED